MNIFGNIASVLAVLVSLAAIIGFVFSRRQVAVEEGKHLANIEQLRRELDQANQKIRDLEDGTRALDVCVGEIKANIERLLDAVKRIENKLDGHIVNEVKK